MASFILILLGGTIVLLLSILCARLWSFTAQVSKDYMADGAQIDLRTHLNGPIACEGVIFGPFGRVTSRFVGEFEARWDGNVGVMTEIFRYDSGATQQREWHLAVGNDGRIQATAPDVIGTGIGMQLGSAVRLEYRLKLPDESGGYVLDANDWMYLVPGGAIVNRSQFRKFGIKVAELVATMRPIRDNDVPMNEAI